MNKVILVNSKNKLPYSYSKRVRMVSCKDYFDNDILVEEETYNSYLKLKCKLNGLGIKIAILSGYRDDDLQDTLFKFYNHKYGEEICSSLISQVNYSEHHTGLCLDIVPVHENNSLESIDDLFEFEDEYAIIHKYLNEFGFILRYPKDKSNSTGYIYRPWHIRYVGKFVSSIIVNNNLTLEEYLSDFSGIVYVNKPKGVTSFDVVREIRDLFGIKKVGHTGTLDPLATGVMIVAIGKATKVVEVLTSSYKEYVAKVKLGVMTDTLDVTGNVIDTCDVFKVDNLNEVLDSFIGTYLQEVPIFSAVKVSGKKLYDYARNNLDVSLPKREVTIKNISLLSMDNDGFTFKAMVSKGCYIRSLIRDIGKKIGMYAVMEELQRTQQGNVLLSSTSTIDSIRNGNFKIFDIDDVLDYDVIVVDSFLEKKICNGQKLNNIWNITGKVIFKNEKGSILGIYENNDNMLSVWKNF